MVFLCCFISVVVIIFHNLVLFEVIAVFVASPLMHVLCRSLALGTDLVGAGAWVFHSFFFSGVSLRFRVADVRATPSFPHPSSLLWAFVHLFYLNTELRNEHAASKSATLPSLGLERISAAPTTP